MVDWGTVPGWLGAGSLILAFVVFNRDHANAERAQVDLVAAWGEGDYDHRMPGEAEVVEAAISMCLRNASELAVFVKQLAYEVHTRWYVEDREQPMISWDLVDASEPQHLFVDDLQLAPGEAKELPPIKVNLAHLAPEGSRQLAFPGGVKVRVTWLLLIDNASRRWIIRPLGGTRAHRIKWWWRPDQKSMPRKW
jgi:hypothetical protein